MVAIFCRVTAELSPDFIENFPRQFDFSGMLTKICDNIDVDISFQNEVYLLQGDWNSLGRAYNMLVSTLAVYGNASSVCNELTTVAAKGSRPFSALVEAAEAVSRGVELQEQVQNEMTQMNKVSQYTSTSHFPIEYNDHKYDKLSKYSQNSLDALESTSECSSQESRDTGTLGDQNPLQYSDSSELEQENQVNTTNQEMFEIPETVPVEQRSFNSVNNDKVLLKKSEIPDVSDQITPASEQLHPSSSKLKNKNWQENHCIVESVTNKGVICQDCGLQVVSKAALSEHVSQFHQNTSKQNPLAKCDVCEKIFSNVRYMKRHRNCHKDVCYNCAECGKSYKVLKALKDHQKTHNKDYVKPEFKCETCSKSFCSLYLKECHVKSEHLGQKRSFLCQTCGKSFTTKHTLQQHVNAHTGVRPYQCSECGKCFTYEAALRDHKFTHVESKTFVCKYPECEKAFRQRSALKMHEKIHKNPKQFECSECGRGFTQKQALQRHIRAHLGLKPFRCRYCGRTFGDLSIIRRHMKLVHKLNKDVEKWREDIIEETVEQETNDTKTPTIESAGTVLNQEAVITDVAPLSSTETLLRQNMKAGNNIQSETSDTGSALETNQIQNVFVSYNVRSQNLVLANPDVGGFNNILDQVIEYHFKQADDIETGSTSTEKTDIETVASLADTVQDQLLHQENETVSIEKEQIQFLTENLDGTFNTTVDLSKLKRNLEMLIKPNSSIDLNLTSDVTAAETLKPDGTAAEMPVVSGLDNITRCRDMEALSDSLGSLSQSQYYYYSFGNQSLNANQNQLNSSLNTPDIPTDRNAP